MKYLRVLGYMIHDFFWFWAVSFKYMAPKSKTWIILYGLAPMSEFMKQDIRDCRHCMGI